MKTTLLFSVFFIPLLLTAQLTSDDFDSYTLGSFDSQWDPSEWVGWFGAASNATIVATQSNSSPNSLLIEDNAGVLTDIVALFGTLNSGIYELTFMQYIPSGNGAYYNLQHNYTNSAGDWAAEIYFSDGAAGQASMITNGVQTPFAIVHDQWVEHRHVFNFLSETAEFYYDGALVHTWQISTNSSGGAGLNQINGLNLFAACLDAGSGCTPLAYYDDILVDIIPLPDYDVSLTEPQRPTEYTMVPDGHVQPFRFETDVANAGGQTVNNVQVTAKVFDGSNTLVHTEPLGSVASISSGMSSNFFSQSSFTPTTSDDFSIEYTVTMDETDANPGDNEFIGDITFEISDSVYARDDGNYDNGIGINNGSGMMGQSYEFIENALVKSISMSYRGIGIGEKISGKVYSTDVNGAPDELIASTLSHILETAGGPDADVYVNMEFADPLALLPGTYVFLIEQQGMTNLLLSTTPEIYTPGATWASTDNGGTWSNLEDFGFSFAMNVRPILDLTIDVDEPSVVENFSISPNPTNGKATIFLDLEAKKDIRFDIFNLQGQLVKSIKDHDASGSNQYPVDLTDLANGVYLVRLMIDDQVVTRNLNIVK